MRLLNVKIDDTLRGLIIEAVAISGVPNQSIWVREALEAGARAEIASVKPNPLLSPEDGAEPIPSSTRSAPRRAHLGFHERAQAQSCVHPAPARRQTVEAEVCSLCGAVTRWRL